MKPKPRIEYCSANSQWANKQSHAGMFEASYPAMPGPTPLLAAYGKTECEALQNLKAKAEQDKLAECWNDLIDWTLWCRV